MHAHYYVGWAWGSDSRSILPLICLLDRIKYIPVIIKPFPEMRGDRLPFSSSIVGKMERIQSVDLLKLLDAAATEMAEAAATIYRIM